jgi:hypothetical protein
VRWIFRKIDSLIGTILAAVTGLAAWQLLVFIAAYLQRLGGHRDEAKRAFAELLGGETGRAMSDAALRDKVMAIAQQRVDALQGAHQAIEQASVFTRPIVFFARMDPDIALAAARDFQPALPLDAPSLVFGGIGIVLGWLTWELIKAPAALLRKRRAVAQ